MSARLLTRAAVVTAVCGLVASTAIAFDPPKDKPADTKNNAPKESLKAKEKAAGPKAGDVAPAWKLKDAAGKEHSLEEFKGKVVLMDFWATWCGPCKAAMPHVQKTHETYKDKGVVVIGIDTWEKGRGGSTEKATAYMKEKGYTYMMLADGDETAKAYGVTGIPAFFVVGQDGKVLFAGVGAGEENAKKITDTIDSALKGKNADTGAKPHGKEGDKKDRK